MDVLTREIQQEFHVSADFSLGEVAEVAQAALLKHAEVFDPRELRRALLRKLQRVMTEEAMAEAQQAEEVARFLDVILATHPELLWEAQKQSLATHAELTDAEER